MPYSQHSDQYSQYNQRPPYQENQQQPPWNTDAFATSAPFQDYSQYPRETGIYDDQRLATSSEQNAPSPNYSQYLDFEAMDKPTTTGAGNIAPQQPTVFYTPPLQTMSPGDSKFQVKTEPGELPHELAFAQDFTASLPYASLPQTCGSMSTCLQILDNPDVEMEDFNLGGLFASPTVSPPEHQTIRRPTRTVSGSLQPSRKPSSATDSGSSSTNHKDHTKPPRKRTRKSTATEAGSKNDAEASQAEARAKQAHSIVERRYRDNLNGKIMQLHHTLSSISSAHASLHANNPELNLPTITTIPSYKNTSSHSSTPYGTSSSPSSASNKVRKSDIMTDAMNYVHQSEVSMRHMSDEITRLTERVRTLEKLVRCEDCVLLKEVVRRSLEGQAQGLEPQVPVQWAAQEEQQQAMARPDGWVEQGHQSFSQGQGPWGGA